MKQLAIILFSLLTIGSTVLAQRDTSINKDVVVVREYNPTISDANKINLIPEIKKPDVINETFNYSFFARPLQTDFSIIPLTPATLAPEPKRKYDQNYITAGLGNYSSLFGELYYNAFQSDKHSLVFKATNNSAFGNVKLQDNSKEDASFVKNNIDLTYKRQFWGSYLKANLNFSNYNYRYYGYQTLRMDSVGSYYAFNDTNNVSIKNSDIHGTDKPGYASFKANFLLASNPTIYDEMAYKAELSYDHFFTRIGLSKDVIGLAGFFENPLGDNMIGGDLYLKFGMYNTPSDTIKNWEFANFTAIAFSPYFKIKRQSWDLKLGINTFFTFEKDNNDYLVTPDIEFNFNLIENLFTAQILASGDYKLNDYRSIVAQNPFISPELNVSPTQVPLILQASLKGQLTPKIVFNGGVKFAIVENNPFFVNAFYKDSISQASTSTYTNQFIAEYDDMNVLTVEAALDYAGNEKYGFGLSGAYYNYSPDNLENVYHLPEYILKLYGRFVPYKNIIVNGSFTTIGKRDALVADGLVTAIDELKPVYDLSFTGEYRYNNRISGFVNLNNILASKYYNWNGYPSFGFNMMVGAKYKF